MTPEQKELARHALGLSAGQKKSYRNRFVAGKQHRDYANWEDMVSKGFAVRFEGSKHGFGASDLFCMTRVGAIIALNKGERLDEEDFPS